MRQRSTALKTQSLSLLLVIGLAAVIVLLTLFSVQADDGSALPISEQPDLETTESFPVIVQSTEATSMTLHLPYVLRTYPLPPGIFGLQMGSITAAGGLAEAVEAKVQWVRRGTLHWNEMEPVRTNPPTYKWEKVDVASFINADKNGMEVVAVVNLAPDWALRDGGLACGPLSQAGMVAFGEFLNEVVARYSQPPYNVRYWEIGNEPDLDPDSLAGDYGFGCWGDPEDQYFGGGYFAEMLKIAYPAIKAADPHAQVILGGLLLDCDPNQPGACNHMHGTAPYNFLEGVLINGGGEAFDILGFHTYSYFGGVGFMGNLRWPGSDTAVVEKASFVRGVLAQYGYPDKPLMNTEAALLCKDEWLPLGCRDQQAVYMPRAYADALAAGLEAQLYFGMINDHWFNSGLLEKDLTPRDAYHTFAVTSEYLGQAKYVGLAQGYPAGIEGYRFSGPSGRVELIWSGDSSSRAVVLPSGASAYDRFGKLIASSGAIMVDYGPVWMVW